MSSAVAIPNQKDMLDLLSMIQELVGAPITGSPFFYPISSGALLANATNFPVPVTISQNPFLWMAIVQASATSNSYSISFRDVQRGFDFMPAPVLSAGIVGTAQNPNYLLQPYLFELQSQIQFNFNELSGNPNTINLVLWGINPDQRSLQLLRQLGIYSAQGA